MVSSSFRISANSTRITLHGAACHETLRSARRINAVKADNASIDRCVNTTAIDAKQESLHMNCLVCLRRDGSRMKQEDVEYDGRQCQQTNCVDLRHGCCPFLRGFLCD